MSEKTPFWTSLPGILTGLAGVLAGIVGLITVLGLGDSNDGSRSVRSTPPAQTATGPERLAAAASIAAPARGAGVCYEQEVRGTATGVPESSDLWLFVKDLDNERVFPVGQADRFIRAGRTNWSGMAIVGSSPNGEEVGQAYELQIVSASASASRSLGDYVKRPDGELAIGLENLPSGTQRLDEVYVKRDAC